MSNAQIERICREFKITDYLRSKGIDPVSRGKRIAYHCPLPDHKKDNTPSFFVTETPTGELYKCFGCGAGGGIVSLVRIMENHKSNGAVIRKLAKIMNVNLDYIADTTSLEPTAESVMCQFCEEDYLAIIIANSAKEFIKANWKDEDAVNKILMVYQQMDKLIQEGKESDLIKILEKLTHAIESYES